MREFDDRLSEIIADVIVKVATLPSGERLPATRPYIEQIHRAVKDAGYARFETQKEANFAKWNALFEDFGYMTGREWLARFEEEFPDEDMLPELLPFRAQVMAAAKRAAGIEK